MECPFCAEEIKQDAVICRHCQRDIGPFRLVLNRIMNLESKLGEGGAGLVELAGQVSAIEQKFEELKIALLTVNSGRPKEAGETIEDVLEPSRTVWWKISLLGAFAPILALLATYVLTVFVYDLDVLVLRLFSILIPLPFGFWLVRSARRAMWSVTLTALAVGMISVWAMSAILAWHDQVSLLPQDMREWREVIEYIASIALSYLTGAFVARWLMQRRYRAHAPGPLARQLARALTDDGAKQASLLLLIQRTIDKIWKGLSYFVPTACMTLSLYTGLKSFFQG